MLLKHRVVSLQFVTCTYKCPVSSNSLSWKQMTYNEQFRNIPCTNIVKLHVNTILISKEMVSHLGSDIIIGCQLNQPNDVAICLALKADVISFFFTMLSHVISLFCVLSYRSTSFSSLFNYWRHLNKTKSSPHRVHMQLYVNFSAVVSLVDRYFYRKITSQL